jgi:hypothetical protein
MGKKKTRVDKERFLDDEESVSAEQDQYDEWMSEVNPDTFADNLIEVADRLDREDREKVKPKQG